MNEDDIVAEALKLIKAHGEERAFQVAGLEMERMACAGDLHGMQRQADLMLAIATLGEMAEDRTVH